MKYKGYEAIVTFDEDANIFHGEVINTRDVITFQGTTVAELKKALRESVEDYLAFCVFGKLRRQDSARPPSAALHPGEEVGQEFERLHRGASVAIASKPENQKSGFAERCCEAYERKEAEGSLDEQGGVRRAYGVT
jgi:predicted HicB family RNase H-like nuclease